MTNMHAIYKYPLQITDVQRILVADPVRPLSVQVQRDGLCLWYEVRPDGPIRNVEVFITRTGHRFDGALVDNDFVYVGTVQFQDALVWHVFCRLV